MAAVLPPSGVGRRGDGLIPMANPRSELSANVLHVRFAARAVDEEVDQITAFGRDVAPLLGAGV